VTIDDWVLILLGAAVVLFFVLLGLLVLLDQLGVSGRGEWD
jgi:hypothetical protein